MRLSDHFTLAEAIRSQTAQRHGIDNTPPEDIIPSLIAVAENILEPVRIEFERPFSPSSWYRCPELNSRIGGSSRSQHAKGEAVDFEIPGISNWVLAGWIRGNLDFDQLIYEFMIEDDDTAGWVHCSYVGEDNRNMVLRAYPGGRYEPWQ